ncbi:hypothetical protein DL769_010620 [Monosporascus sp. CRB-8-3]|nr:hypothetical protein DL769_010620 [Monosporascus sp. CRB-8-3]
MQSCCSSISACNISATCTCNALLCACPRVSQPEHPDRIACICSPSGKACCRAAEPANTQAAGNHVEDRPQAESESLANKSRRLLTEIRNLDSIRAGSEAASLMAADPAIVQVGTARGPTLEAASRRLLTLVENMAVNPRSPGAVDPAVLRMGPPRQVVRKGVSGGDHEVLQGAKSINPEQLDRLLPFRIQSPDQSPDHILEDLKAVDPSIIRRSLQELKQLNLSNFDTAVRSGGPADEDELVLAAMRHGAHWWPSLSFYSHHYERLSGRSVPYDSHFPPRINVGYPSFRKSGLDVQVFRGCDELGRARMD